MTFRAQNAAQAYSIALDKSVHAALQIRVTDERGKVVSLDELAEMARLEPH